MYVGRVTSHSARDYYGWRWGIEGKYESAGLSEELRGHYKRVMPALASATKLRDYALRR
jgi:hypothetical protein